MTMKNDITELAQRLKAAAEKATKGQWVAFTDTATKTFAVHTPNDKRCENIIKWSGFDCQKNAKANAEFIAMANPANVLALVEALELKEEQRANWFQMAQKLGEDLDAVEKRIAELESRTVNLPDLRQIVSGDRYVWSDGVFNYSQDVKEILTAAGIKLEAE